MISLHLIILAVVQGITEFLPISSSGHLAMTPILMGVEDQGILIDAAVHVGSLGAVMLYFYRDVISLFIGLGHILSGKRTTTEARLLAHLIVATIPLVIGGYLAYATGMLDAVRNITVIAWATLGFGVVLYVADRFGAIDKAMEDMKSSGAFLIGLSQIIALIPGASRSGMTMTAARALGYDRVSAARFAMLMSIPAILAAGTLTFYELFTSGEVALQNEAFVAAGLSFVVAFTAISLFMKWIGRIGMGPFALYRVVMGVFLLLAYS